MSTAFFRFSASHVNSRILPIVPRRRPLRGFDVSTRRNRRESRLSRILHVQHSNLDRQGRQGVFRVFNKQRAALDLLRRQDLFRIFDERSPAFHVERKSPVSGEFDFRRPGLDIIRRQDLPRPVDFRSSGLHLVEPASLSRHLHERSSDHDASGRRFPARGAARVSRRAGVLKTSFSPRSSHFRREKTVSGNVGTENGIMTPPRAHGHFAQTASWLATGDNLTATASPAPEQAPGFPEGYSPLPSHSLQQSSPPQRKKSSKLAGLRR